MNNRKKAIVLVSVGTANEKARKNTLDGFEKEVTRIYSDYDVRQAYTSHHIRNLLNKKYGIALDSPEEALERLFREGYEEILVQPILLIPGAEFHELVKIISVLDKRGIFKCIKLGRCLLHLMGDGKFTPDDFGKFAETLISEYQGQGPVVFVGHGTTHPSNAAYACLSTILKRRGDKNFYLGTLMSYPSVHDVIMDLKGDEVVKVTLVPLMIVAGNHMIKDIASEREESWESILKSNGFTVKAVFKGLGDIEGIRDLLISRIGNLISEEN